MKIRLLCLVGGWMDAGGGCMSSHFHIKHNLGFVGLNCGLVGIMTIRFKEK